MHCVEISGHESGTTTDGTPLPLALTPIEVDASVLMHAMIMARRSDTGAAKTWAGHVAVKRVGETVSVQEVDVTVLASAADATAMSGVSIALFEDGQAFAVNCTGLPGVTIDWCVDIRGWNLQG